ncbi:PREDICTED: ankyrin repeat and sterile alpha motif domain-containing protein 1B-like [Acropora digitifera]|uniref:ankyrin repeat and sterile alpha motif domain-containing protein 1B-like n=1 Tax=Acropora digitifera TaxID=70779 RepID=UPI00077A9AB3|nr:PREDICTED: ankyrin repeat and sterile alpha motif domain-containing protein 1B-like [Acropora digitifera]
MRTSDTVCSDVSLHYFTATLLITEPCVANGFDNIHFLNGVMDDEDLLKIGIVDFSHRRTIMEAMKSLPACPRLSDLAATAKPESLTDWLKLICLLEYFPVFQQNGFDSMERLHMLWEVELTSVLKINSLGHRKRILASLKEDVKEPEMGEQTESTNLETSSAHLEQQLAELKLYCPDEKPDQPIALTRSRKYTNELMATAEQMVANAKEVKIKKVICSTSVSFTVVCLISTNLETSSAHLEQQLAELKLYCPDEKPDQPIALTRSRKYTNELMATAEQMVANAKEILVSNHEMRNISYITQDPEDRRVFAYIAKDAKTDKHYCHVFRMDVIPLSDEVTMTIGQAFELAFNMFVHVKDRPPQH